MIDFDRKIHFWQGLRIKILILILLIYIISFSAAGMIIYFQSRANLLNYLGEKLKAIAATTATSIDVSQHEQLRSPEDENSPTYKEIQNHLKRIVAANPGIDSIYTMRRSDKKNIWLFVVDSYETTDLNKNGRIEPEEEKAHLGEEYDVSPYPEMQKAFTGPQADKEITTDKWGSWISGYAPLYDRQGQAVAIVGVDYKASEYLTALRQVKILILSIGLLWGVFFLLVTSLFLYFILIKRLGMITTAISLFSSGNLDARIKAPHWKDELETLANAFDQMAERIQKHQFILEKTIKQKTASLQKKTYSLEKSQKKLQETQIALMNILEDVEEGKKAIEELKSKYEFILQNIGEAICVVNPATRIILVNKIAEKLIQIPASRLINQPAIKVIKIVDKKGTPVRPFYELLKTEKSQKWPLLYLINSQKEKIPINFTGSLLRDSQNNLLGAIGIFRDISYEQKLDQMKNEFVSITAHELRTPMTAIKGYLSMILEGDFGPIKPELKKVLQETYTSNERLIRLIGDVLDVSRLEEERMEIREEVVDITTIINSVVSELAPKASAKNLYLKVKPLPTHLHVLADPDKLKQVLVNLIGNAIKFTDQGGVKIEVELSKKEPPEVIVNVIDTGIGIARSDQPLLFRKFQQLEKKLLRHPGGTGLGLYISKELIKRMNGKIWLKKSIPGKGSTFSFSLPLFKKGEK